MAHYSVQPEKQGFTNDRCTVVIRTHYQEFDPGSVTTAEHTYDFTNKRADSPWQTSQRIGPSSRVPLNLGHLNPGSCMLVLSHDVPKMSAKADPVLLEAMQRNVITLTNSDGVAVGILRARRAAIIEFPFPVFAQSSEATALLSITAIPVHNEEIPAE